MTPHRQLLADYADSGSEEAFRELVESYIGMVHGSALRLVNGNSQLAEDIAQSVFTDLARKAKTLAPEVMIGGWLHRRTCHAAANALRSEYRRLNRERQAFEMNALNTNDADEALAAVAPMLDDAINQLPDDDRDAIVLRFFERSNLRAVGEALGTSEGAAQKRVERALEKLRGLLLRRGIGLTAAALALAVGTASATAAPAGLGVAVASSAAASGPAGGGIASGALKFLAVTKLKAAVIASVVALAAIGTTTTVILTGEASYTPPPHPNPQKILYEAQADTTAGRYKDAEAKFIWYRDNALKYQPSQVGVRDSFALSYWSQLAEKYPPARKRLNSIRDEAEKELRNKPVSGSKAMTDFIVILSINNGSKDDAKTLALFKWLDAYDQKTARQAYSLVEMQLIAAGEYALCGRYMDPDVSYQRILNMYQMTMDSVGKMKNLPTAGNAPQLRGFAETNFIHQAATVVAALSINNRQEDANRIAGEALKQVNTPEFSAIMTDAKNGKVPPRWP